MTIAVMLVAGLVILSISAAYQWGRSDGLARLEERVRYVDVPRFVGHCAKCHDPLHPQDHPKQLYLELWDTHGNQRAKWIVGKGGNLAAISMEPNESGLLSPGWFRMVDEIRAAVMYANTIDGAE